MAKTPPEKGLLRAIREKRGLTLAEVGAKIGLSGAQYSRYEKETDKLTVRQLKMLSDLFSLTFEEIINNEVSEDLLRRYARSIPLVPLSEIGPDGLDRSVPFEEYTHPECDTSDEAFAVRAEDDSMGILMRSGAKIIVEPAKIPTPGNPVLVWDDDEKSALIRNYHKIHKSDPLGPGFKLVAENKAYPNVFVKENSKTKIIGCCIGSRVNY
jgi:transcriptional regulator with XRE-family HTH domain